MRRDDFAGSSGRLSHGRGCSAGCEDNFEGYESGAFSGAGSAGRGENTFDGSVRASENSLVVGGAAHALGDVDVSVACWENNLGGHVVEFKILLLAASAESGYSLNCFNSFDSLVGHPSMHAPSLARVFDGRVVGSVGWLVVRELVKG